MAWRNITKTKFSCEIRLKVILNGNGIHLKVLLSLPNSNHIWSYPNLEVPIPFQALTDVRQHIAAHDGPISVYEEIECLNNKSENWLAISQIHASECLPDKIEEEGHCPFVLQFQCGEFCFKEYNLCDLHNDCPNGEDENLKSCQMMPYQSTAHFETYYVYYKNEFWPIVSPQSYTDVWKIVNPYNATKYFLLPKVDSTFSNSSGHFLLWDGRLSSHEDEEFYLQSRYFPPAPNETYDKSSPYYTKCQLRFYFNQKSSAEVWISVGGRNVITKKEFEEVNIFTEFYGSEIFMSDVWIFINRSIVDFVPPNSQYWFFINVISHESGEWYKGWLAFDDFSLSPECYGIETLTSSVFNLGYSHLYNVSNVSSVFMKPIYEIFIDNIAVFNFFIYHDSAYAYPCTHIYVQSTKMRLRSSDNCDIKTFDMMMDVMYLNEKYKRIPLSPNLFSKHSISRENIYLLSKVGSGAFGCVYKALYIKKASNLFLPVAVKHHTKSISKPEDNEEFMMEALILSNFCHPNIVKFIGVCFENYPFYIITEYLEGGDLRCFLKRSRLENLKIKDSELISFAIDVCNACVYLEEKKFLHLDIASRNCLLTSFTNSENKLVKIADFGLSRKLTKDYYRKSGSCILPIKWMPPEAIVDAIFSSKTDVWSFGVLLWEIFSLGMEPYFGKSNREVIDSVASGERLGIPKKMTNHDIYQIMQQCWSNKSELRPSFKFILSSLERNKHKELEGKFENENENLLQSNKRYTKSLNNVDDSKDSSRKSSIARNSFSGPFVFQNLNSSFDDSSPIFVSSNTTDNTYAIPTTLKVDVHTNNRHDSLLSSSGNSEEFYQITPTKTSNTTDDSGIVLSPSSIPSYSGTLNFNSASIQYIDQQFYKK